MPLYVLLDQLHYWSSRIGLAAAVVMLGIAVYIGLIRHGDVTSWFRRLTYFIVAFIVWQSAIGLWMYALGGRPYQEVHLVYGVGAALALPFFIFVERTATKRPAMGSYIWGFALLAGVIVRTIVTGASS